MYMSINIFGIHTLRPEYDVIRWLLHLLFPDCGPNHWDNFVFYTSEQEIQMCVPHLAFFLRVDTWDPNTGKVLMLA